MYDGVQNILDHITFLHGPRDLLAEYARTASETAAELGVQLRISRDFNRLIALNKQQSDSWEPLSPIFDPNYSDLNADMAFFVEGIDASGDTVVTSAGRLYDFGDRSLAGELRSLRVFFAQPRPFLAAGETIEVAAPAAEHICGRTMFSGAVWVRPDYRRHGFTRIIPRLTRSYALTLWNTPVFWMLIEPELDRVGVTRAYGSWHIDGKIVAHLPTWRGSLHLLLCTMGQTTLIRDLMNSVYGTSVGTSRRMDTPMANELPRERQGMSTRS